MSGPSKSIKNKLKIGLVLDDTLDTPDGVQQYVTTVGRWLSAKGHEVHYLVGESMRTDIPNVHSLSKNVRVRFNGNNLSIPLPASKRRIRTLLEAIGLDVLHVQMPYSPLLASRVVLSAPQDMAILGTFHVAPYGPLANQGARILGAASHRITARFDKIIAVSQPAAEMAKRTYGVKPEILGNAFDFAKYSNAKPFKRKAELELLFLGRLVKRKGCQTLLSALMILERSIISMPDYRLTIAGEGHLKPELQAFAASHCLGQKVRFVGFISEVDKPRYYATSDIAVFPSISGESFGFVLLEAMANAHTAVVAADNPGYAALLQAMPQALFKADDEVALAEKLKDLIFDPLLRKNLGTGGQVIAKSYDIDRIGASLYRYYEQALLKRHP